MIAKHVRNLKNYEPDYNFTGRPARASCDRITLPDGQSAYVQFVGIQRGVSRSNVKQRLLSTLPLLKDNEIVGAPDGVYAWIYSSKGLVACPVFSKLEFGSRHFDMLRRMEIEADAELYGAGEFRKVDNKITYNIASGSVTVQLMRKMENGSGYMNENAASVAENAARAFASLEGIESEYTGNANTFIDMPLTFEQVKFYESLGYNIHYYKNEENCKNPSFTEPAVLFAQIDQDERMKETMRRLLAKNPEQLAEKLAKLDASIHEKEMKMREYMHLVGGTRRRKQHRKRGVKKRRTAKHHRA